MALIVAKFAVAVALALGAAALAGGGPRPPEAGAVEAAGISLASMLAGASLMALAAFTPFVVLRILPILETAVVAQGISRSPARAAQTGAQGVYYAQGLQRMAGGSRPGGRPAPNLATVAQGGLASAAAGAPGRDASANGATAGRALPPQRGAQAPGSRPPGSRPRRRP